MKKKSKRKDPWLLTYSDMITLLLVFFVVFVSIVKPEVIKTKIILSSLLGNLGFLENGNSFEDVNNVFVTLGNVVQSLPSEEFTRQKLGKADNISQFIFNNLNNTRKVRIIENQEGVVISLFSDIFFEPNSDQLNYDSVKSILENIRQLIDSYKFQGEILINGHTDNMPYSGSVLKDNWELSMARALAVFNALRKIPFVYPLNTERISIHGYAENRPIESNDTPEGRSYNRRVDIVLKPQ